MEGAERSLGLGLRGCVEGCMTIRPRTGLRWVRSTEADGEGDVWEARHTESAPAALDKGPLIDGCLGSPAIVSPPVLTGVSSWTSDRRAQGPRQGSQWR